MRLSRVDERLLPAGVGAIDADGRESAGARGVERDVEIGDLEGEMVRPGNAAGDETSEEIAVFRLPGLEQLDLHPTGAIADEHLHRTEADGLTSGQDGSAQHSGEEAHGRRGIGRGERDMIEIGALLAHTGALAAGRNSPRPARVVQRAIT